MLKERRYFEFGDFRLEVKERALLRNGVALPLTPKAFDTLLLLVENAGSLVERDEMMRAIWPDSFVEDVGLARNISVLRKALGQDDGGQQFIETVPKRGYRFTASVREIVDEAQGVIRDKSSRSQALELHHHSYRPSERSLVTLTTADAALAEASSNQLQLAPPARSIWKAKRPVA